MNIFVCGWNLLVICIDNLLDVVGVMVIGCDVDCVALVFLYW